MSFDRFAWDDGDVLIQSGGPVLIKFNQHHAPKGSPAGGQFTSADGEGVTVTHVAATQKDGKWVGHDGGPLPEHLKAVRIPPKWTDVTYSLDPKNKLQVTGLDAKGRRQAIYSKEFSSQQAAAKFARIDELNRKYDSIWQQNEAARKVAATRDVADCMRVIMQTGIRPGSEKDTGAEKQAYGATTLKGSHVYVNGDYVRLTFTGKKGVKLSIPITDPETKRMLIGRKEAAGGRGSLFGVSEKDLLAYVRTFDGGSFTTKDFRTLLGTRTAMNEIARMRAPNSEKAYKKAVRAVAAKVSDKLGNTPTVALQSYINPTVFADWRMGAGV